MGSAAAADFATVFFGLHPSSSSTAADLSADHLPLQPLLSPITDGVFSSAVVLRRTGVLTSFHLVDTSTLGSRGNCILIEQGGGWSSARETIGRVAAGAVAKKILKMKSGTEKLINKIEEERERKTSLMRNMGLSDDPIKIWIGGQRTRLTF